MAQISGFGGAYEEQCRKMVVAGIKFLDENSELDPHFSEHKYIHGVYEENEDAEKLTQAMNQVTGNLASSIMMFACVNHVLLIKRQGWEYYVKFMRELKLKKMKQN